MRWLLIPVAAALVWPVYAWASRRSPERRFLRVLLGIAFGLTVLVDGCVGMSAWRGLPADHARSDDALTALVMYGALQLGVSLVVLGVGEAYLALRRLASDRRSG